MAADGERGAGRSGEDAEEVATPNAPQQRVEELVNEYVVRLVPVGAVAVDQSRLEATLSEKGSQAVGALIRPREEH